jgi:phage-related holin
MGILLMAINSYYIGGYQWLLVVVLLMVIGDYSTNGH